MTVDEQQAACNKKQSEELGYSNASQANLFFAALGYGPDDPIELRILPGKDAPEYLALKTIQRTIKRALLTEVKFLRWLNSLNRDHGIYSVINIGGRSDAAITRYIAVFCENDNAPIVEQQARLNLAPVATSIRVETKKSVHAYWLIDRECSECDWREMQERLIHFSNGDGSIKNPSRVMRLPGFNHVQWDVDEGRFVYTPVRLVQCEPSNKYTTAQLLDAFPSARKQLKENLSHEDLNRIYKPGRNNRMTSIAGSLRRQGLAPDVILASLFPINQRLCDPPLLESELQKIALSMARYEAGNYNGGEPSSEAGNQKGSDEIEFEGDDPPVSADLKRERYLRQLARNTAKILDAIRLLMSYLGFEKNHTRLLNALICIGRDRLGVYIATQKWIQERYRDNGEKSVSCSTVYRDIAKLQKEQKTLGLDGQVIWYQPGYQDRAKVNHPSKFQNKILRYALEAINMALDTKTSGDFEYSWEALENACRIVAGHVPRSVIIEMTNSEKPFTSKTQKSAVKLVKIQDETIDDMIAEKWTDGEINEFFQTVIEPARKQRIKENRHNAIAMVVTYVKSDSECDNYNIGAKKL
ncbi:MAG: primase alpha helix C-terminal domain-containing protein [Blastocatellia bacterium]